MPRCTLLLTIIRLGESELYLEFFRTELSLLDTLSALRRHLVLCRSTDYGIATSACQVE